MVCLCVLPGARPRVDAALAVVDMGALVDPLITWRRMWLWRWSMEATMVDAWRSRTSFGI